jgi:hypothetical protein
MRLNLGCGHKKLSGFVNVDKSRSCDPDELVDLEKLPWPWADDSAEEVMLSHVLAELGAAPDLYLGIMQELYRVCRDGTAVTIVTTHPRHDMFLDNPANVRPITVDGLALFSQSFQRQYEARGYPGTPLGIELGIDFSLQGVNIALDEPWLGRLQRGEISESDMRLAVRSNNNVASALTVVLHAVKPAGRMG